MLVEPRSDRNVGATARALQNLGFSRLVLVRPRFSPPGIAARRMAVDAAGLVDRAVLHDSLDDALAGAGTVVGTTRRKGKQRRPHWRLDRFAGDLARLAGLGEIAVLFGREDRGLDDTSLDRCTHLVYLPAAEACPSFNLAQAVLLVAWELRRAALADEPPPEPLDPPASHAAREAMYGHLLQACLAIGYLHDNSVVTIMRRLRRMLGRATMTTEEVALLRGLARQILWAARRAGLSVPEAPAKRSGR